MKEINLDNRYNNYQNLGDITSQANCTCYNCGICIACIAFLPVSSIVLVAGLTAALLSTKSHS